MQYEGVTQNVLLLIDSVLQNAKQRQHTYLSFHVRCQSDIQFPSKCSADLQNNPFECSNNSELQ
jgi:hypothetical protein